MPPICLHYSIEKKNDERRLTTRKVIGKIISHCYSACESAFFNQHLAKKRELKWILRLYLCHRLESVKSFLIIIASVK